MLKGAEGSLTDQERLGPPRTLQLYRETNSNAPAKARRRRVFASFHVKPAAGTTAKSATCPARLRSRNWVMSLAPRGHATYSRSFVGRTARSPGVSAEKSSMPQCCSEALAR